MLQLKGENIIFEAENVVKEKRFKNRLSLFFHDKMDVDPQYCPACGYVKKVITSLKRGIRRRELYLQKFLTTLLILYYENNVITAKNARVFLRQNQIL